MNTPVELASSRVPGLTRDTIGDRETMPRDLLHEREASLTDCDDQVELPSLVLAGEELAQRHLIVVVGEARDIDGLAVIVQAFGKTVTNDSLKVAVDAERYGRAPPSTR